MRVNIGSDYGSNTPDNSNSNIGTANNSSYDDSTHKNSNATRILIIIQCIAIRRRRRTYNTNNTTNNIHNTIINTHTALCRSSWSGSAW